MSGPPKLLRDSDVRPQKHGALILSHDVPGLLGKACDFLSLLQAVPNQMGIQLYTSLHWALGFENSRATLVILARAKKSFTVLTPIQKWVTSTYNLS